MKKKARGPEGTESSMGSGQRAGGDTICVQNEAKPSAGKSIRAGPCFLQPGIQLGRTWGEGRGTASSSRAGPMLPAGIVGRIWGKRKDNNRPWVSHHKFQNWQKALYVSSQNTVHGIVSVSVSGQPRWDRSPQNTHSIYPIKRIKKRDEIIHLN